VFQVHQGIGVVQAVKLRIPVGDINVVSVKGKKPILRGRGKKKEVTRA